MLPHTRSVVLAQAAVYNELARIETQQRTIMEQLEFVKKQRCA